MNAVITIALNTLRVFFASRGNLIGLVLLPIALTVLIGWDFGGGGPTRLRVDLLDLDQSALSAQLLADLHEANATLVFCPQENDTEDFCQLEGAVLDRELGIARAQREITDALVVIPTGYGAAITTAQPLQLDVYTTADPSTPGPVLQTLNSVLQATNSAVVAGQVGARFLTILQGVLRLEPTDSPGSPLTAAVFADAERRLRARPELVRFVTTSAEPAGSTLQQRFGQSVPGMGSMYVMFTVLGGMATLLRERQQWTLQRLAVLPITRAQILGGKILAYFSLGMLQYFVVFAVGLVVGIDFGRDPLALLLIMAAFVLCVTALAFALATRVQSEGQANGLQNLLGLTLAPLGGAWWPLEIVPRFMQQIGHLSPVAWAMDAFHALLFNQGTLDGVLPQMGVLVGAAALLFIIGVRGFRVE
ncbi:MAG: ABC transporter permease [Caldilineaceae bacterium]